VQRFLFISSSNPHREDEFCTRDIRVCPTKLLAKIRLRDLTRVFRSPTTCFPCGLIIFRSLLTASRQISWVFHKRRDNQDCLFVEVPWMDLIDPLEEVWQVGDACQDMDLRQKQPLHGGTRQHGTLCATKPLSAFSQAALLRQPSPSRQTAAPGFFHGGSRAPHYL